MKDRSVRILDILAKNKSVKVTLLAELMDVSQVTLRKDLDNLEKMGIIHRSHGYASLDGADDTGKRMAINYSIKRKIAKAAANTIENGETIMLESSSCCAMFAEELAILRKNVTIITNSTFIANYICHLHNIKIILLGGFYQSESHTLIGPMTINCAESFYTDKLFLGTDGFISGQGFTGRDYFCVETVLGLANHADKIFVLTESAKFNRRGAYNKINLDKVTGVFTDDKIPIDVETVLLKNDVSIIKVPAVEEIIKWRQFPGLTPILYKERIN
ncbi:MAG: DeoR/GlpR family DNA-binding transcription regulator [Treponema sp.]|nr:DeoR/GlpR family DNA-binding transcription regulator [Treponema sp.]